MPELRKDPVLGHWVVFSPERLRRPNQFSTPVLADGEAEDDPFREGNEKYTPGEVYAERDAESEVNAPGWQVRVVPNRFPALRIEGELNKEAVGFYDRMNGVGAHEVVIETPESGVALEDQGLSGIARVLRAYRARSLDLAKDTRFSYVLVFKNVGAMAGASIAHAHSQVIALPITPVTVERKLSRATEYFQEKERNLYEDVLRNELKCGERLVCENAGFGVFCPFASRFSFEMCVIPRVQRAYFSQCDDHELYLLADVLKKALTALNQVVGRPDYNLIIHTAPVRRRGARDGHLIEMGYRWHLEILPRLTGIAGFEFGTGFHINSVLPEDAASELRGGRL